MDWTAFFNMGGYAFHVWGSYTLASLILGVSIWQAKRRFNTARMAIKQS
jgi:heme exporter protein CcmD